MANEIQTVTFGAVPTAGVWALSFNGDVTSDLAFNTDAGTVQSALGSLPSIVNPSNINIVGNVAVGFTITFVGSLANTNVSQLQVAASTLTRGATTIDVSILTPGATAAYEQQTITLTGPPTAGNFRLGANGMWTDPISYDTVGSAMYNTLSNIGVVTSSITGGSGGPWQITWNNPVSVSLLLVDDSQLDIPGYTVVRDTAGQAPAQEVQRLTLSNSPDGGTWLPQTNAPSCYFNAMSSEVESSLSDILGSNVVTVSGSGPYVVTWIANGDQSTLTPDGSNLTKSINTTVMVTQQGSSVSSFHSIQRSTTPRVFRRPLGG